MFKILDYTDVNFFTPVFKTKTVINKIKKRGRRERDKVLPVIQELGYKENVSCWQYQCKKWNGHTGEG